MVEVRGISFAYDKNAGRILDDVSFSLREGECLAVLGNNGAGKSTLLKCIDRICPPEQGTVLVDGRAVAQMSRNETARNIAYVPQHGCTGSMTVYDAVLLGRKPYIQWDATAEDRRITVDLLQKMGLEPLALRTVSQLSGGEAQKVALARALAQEPRLLLLDEPTSNLDPRNQHEALRLVKRIAREHNICVIIVIHDLNLAIRYCDRFVFLRDARVYAHGGPETMTPENIEAVYRMHVHITMYMGIPVLVPFPDEPVPPGADG